MSRSTDALVRQILAATSPEAPPARPSARVRLIETGERLIAEGGLDAVSLRQVAAEAGTANRSAVRYHFGSREGLVQAIIEHRLPRLNECRRQLLADAVATGSPLDLRSALRAYLVPLFDEAEDDGSWFVCFIEQLQQFAPAAHPFDRSPDELQQPSRAFLLLLASFLGGLPEVVRSNRIVHAAMTATHAAADRQRSRRRDPAAVEVPYDLFVSDLVDSIVGALEAPMSRETRRAVRASYARPSTQRARRSHSR